MEEGANINAKSLNRHQGSIQSGCFKCFISNLIARQACAAIHPGVHSRLPCLTQARHLAQNLDEYGVVQSVTNETVQAT